MNVVGGSWGETFRAGPLMELRPHDLIEAYRVNVLTMFQCSQAVAPIMKRQGKGAIINIASGAGRRASPNSAAFGASIPFRKASTSPRFQLSELSIPAHSSAHLNRTSPVSGLLYLATSSRSEEHTSELQSQ